MLPVSVWRNGGDGMGDRPLETPCARLATKLEACKIWDMDALAMIFTRKWKKDSKQATKSTELGGVKD